MAEQDGSQGRPQQLNILEPPEIPGVNGAKMSKSQLCLPNETHNGGLMPTNPITLHEQNLDSH